MANTLGSPPTSHHTPPAEETPVLASMSNRQPALDSESSLSIHLGLPNKSDIQENDCTQPDLDGVPHVKIPPIDRMPTELFNAIMGQLPISDLKKVREVCKRFNAKSSHLLCINIGPITVNRLTRTHTKFIKRHIASVKTLTIKHTWNHDKTLAKVLDAKLDNFLRLFKKGQLEVWGFSADSILTQNAYRHVQDFIVSRKSSSNIILPAMKNGSLYTPGYPASPCDAVISFSIDCGAENDCRIRKQRQIFIRKDSGLLAASYAINKPGVMIESVRLFGNRTLISGDQLEALWSAINNLPTKNVPKVWLHNMNIAELSGVFSLGDTQSIGLINSHSWLDYRSYSETDLLAEATKLCPTGEKPLANEIIYRQTIMREDGHFKGLSGEQLKVYVDNVDGLQVLCMHQKASITVPPAALVELHFSSLQIFSFRSGEEDITYEQLAPLVKAAPGLRAIGFNCSHIFPIVQSATNMIAVDSEYLVYQVMNALLPLTELTTLCIFLPRMKIKTKHACQTLYMAIHELASTMNECDMNVHLLHIVVQKSGSLVYSRKSFSAVYSFRIGYNRRWHHTTVERTSLSIQERDDLQKLGGGHDYDMQDFEEDQMGHLCPSLKQTRTEEQTQIVGATKSDVVKGIHAKETNAKLESMARNAKPKGPMTLVEPTSSGTSRKGRQESENTGGPKKKRRKAQKPNAAGVIH